MSIQRSKYGRRPGYRPGRSIVANTEAVVDAEASDLLFEAEDVAELVAEITGEPVEVTADETTVVFAVGDEEYTVEAEGDEEILESSRMNFRNKRPISASTRRSAPRSSRVIRRMPSGR